VSVTDEEPFFREVKLRLRPLELTGETFERLFEQAKIEKLTSKEMKAYKERYKRILEYFDVRDIAEYARDEEKFAKFQQSIFIENFLHF
jgi:hypothetical protein